MSDNYPNNTMLAGVRVLDFSRVMSGPYSTALLADLGAQVIKVEALQGDDYRHIPPFKDDLSALFELMNRGKQSITLNLKDPSATEIIHQLAQCCDVVVENFKPGVAERLKIDFSTLHAINPQLVYASISGFGQTGDMSLRPAYDIIVQAMSGMMAATGFAHTPPTLVGESIGDLLAGLFASWGILAALYQKQHTGLGQYIDVAMFDTLFSMLPTSFAMHAYANQLPQRTGNRHPISVPFGAYQASDGQFMLAVLNDSLFRKLCNFIGSPELAEDQQFNSDAKRSQHEPLIRQHIERWAGDYSVADVVDKLAQQGIPASPIWDIRQASHSKQAQQRQLISHVEHSQCGLLALVEQPLSFSNHPRGLKTPAPKLGEHNRSVLCDILGYSEDQINALQQAAVLGHTS